MNEYQAEFNEELLNENLYAELEQAIEEDNKGLVISLKEELTDRRRSPIVFI